MLTALIIVLSVINVASCVLLILVVLMQRSKNDGIGASFGSGLTDSVFGAQTSTVLVKATTVLAIAFLLSSTLLASSLAYKNRSQTGVQQQLQASDAPEQTPANTSTNAPSATVPAPAAPTVPNPAPVVPAPAKK